MARKRRAGWMADVRFPDGSRARRQFATQHEALAWEAEARQGQAAPAQAPTVTLGEAFAAARADWIHMRAGRDLIRNGRLVVEALGAGLRVDHITQQHVADLKAALVGAGNSPATINRKLAALSVMLRAGGREGFKVRRMREAEGRLHWLDDGHEAMMMTYWRETGDAYNEALSVFLMDTGLRAFVEAGRLRWADIKEDRVHVWEGKGGKHRTVPLTSRARDALATRDRSAPGPFWGLAPGHIRQAWDRMRAATGLDWLTPHILRHTCASRLVMGGVDLRRVRDWLGHSSIQTTMRYAHLSPAALFDAVAVLER